MHTNLKELPKTYFFEEITGYDYKYSTIIKRLLDNHNWTKKSKREPVTYSNKNSLSKIKTYLDGLEQIFLKHRLAHNFKDYYFIEKHFILECSQDLLKLPTYAKKDGIWFLKPSDMRVGSGQDIKLLRFKKNDLFREEVKKHYNPKWHYILQKNIENPKILKEKKFDFRIYGIIVYTPAEICVYLLDLGIIRFAYKKFSSQEVDEKILLTNVSIFERLHPGEDIGKITKLVELKENLFFSKLKAIVKEIFACTFKKYNIRNRNRDSGFITFGLDCILNQDDTIHILEINQHPYFHNFDENTGLDDLPPEGVATVKYFKDFYSLVFRGILKNKLTKNDKGNFHHVWCYDWKENLRCSPVYFSKEYYEKMTGESLNIPLISTYTATQTNKTYVALLDMTRDSIKKVRRTIPDWSKKKVIRYLTLGRIIGIIQNDELIGLMHVDRKTDKKTFYPVS